MRFVAYRSATALAVMFVGGPRIRLVRQRRQIGLEINGRLRSFPAAGGPTPGIYAGFVERFELLGVLVRGGAAGQHAETLGNRSTRHKCPGLLLQKGRKRPSFQFIPLLPNSTCIPGPLNRTLNLLVALLANKRVH